VKCAVGFCEGGEGVLRRGTCMYGMYGEVSSGAAQEKDYDDSKKSSECSEKNDTMIEVKSMTKKKRSPEF